VATGYNGSQVFVYLWDPAANGFSAPSRVFTEPFYGSDFKLVDLENDGKLDIVSYHKELGSRINIIRGNGNGTFRLPLSFQSSSHIEAIAFGDINRDGRLDLAFAKDYEGQFASQLSQCGGSTAGARQIGKTKFDFDGDGKADFGVVRP